jgi:hypothetical protein
VGCIAELAVRCGPGFVRVDALRHQFVCELSQMQGQFVADFVAPEESSQAQLESSEHFKLQQDGGNDAGD